MNLHQRGMELINQLKDHVLEVLQSHPDAGSRTKGVLQDEIARRAGYTTWAQLSWITLAERC